eukprot:1329095-Amorphochlora_amoeboformis.AAC.2
MKLPYFQGESPPFDSAREESVPDSSAALSAASPPETSRRMHSSVTIITKKYHGSALELILLFNFVAYSSLYLGSSPGLGGVHHGGGIWSTLSPLRGKWLN